MTKSNTHDKVLESLLAAKLVEPSKRCQYNAQFFTVPKPGKKVRPVFDYSLMTPHIQPPKFILPNLFQLLNRHTWPKRKYNIKLDIRQCFFNIPLHQKSKHLTTFNYKGKYYQFNVLPFGISLAPFVAQMFCNAIVAKIGLSRKMALGHIDDILVCDKSKKRLKILIFRIKHWFKQAGWPLNIQKSILKPSKTIKYLGAKWTSKQVTRLPEISKNLKEIIGIIPKIKTKKQLQRIRGYLNYYMGYSGPSHRLISIVPANKKSRILNFKYLYPLS